MNANKSFVKNLPMNINKISVLRKTLQSILTFHNFLQLYHSKEIHSSPVGFERAQSGKFETHRIAPAIEFLNLEAPWLQNTLLFTPLYTIYTA